DGPRSFENVLPHVKDGRCLLDGPSMSDNGFRKRLVLLSGALLVAAAGIALRRTVLQVVGSEAYRVRARDQHEGKVQIEGRRGTITDRNGRELAVSIETKSAYVQPCQIPNAAMKERIV